MNKISKFSLILLTLLFLFFAKVPSALACSCARSFPGPLGILKAFGDNYAVFTGKVVDTKLEIEKDNYELTVDVLKSYKHFGRLKQIKIFTNDPNGTTCGYPARKDKEYLFYANETQQGDWSINTCTRTGKLANRVEDISFLDKWISFNDSAFKIYRLVGLPALLPIRHTEPPEYWGPIYDAKSSPCFLNTPCQLLHSDGIIRNRSWFEGWKVFANLFIWTIVLATTLFFIGKFVISKIKKTKLKK